MNNGKASKLSGIFKIKAKCCKKDIPRLKKNKKKKTEIKLYIRKCEVICMAKSNPNLTHMIKDQDHIAS